MRRSEVAGRALAVFAMIFAGILLLALFFHAIGGVSSARAESEYTGHVVDVVEDKGIVYRPSWVNMKTSPRSSDIQQYCIHPDDEARLLPKFYEAMEGGYRVTVTYSRPVWVSPFDCPSGTSIIQDIRRAGGEANE